VLDFCLPPRLNLRVEPLLPLLHQVMRTVMAADQNGGLPELLEEFQAEAQGVDQAVDLVMDLECAAVTVGASTAVVVADLVAAAKLDLPVWRWIFLNSI